MSQSQYQHYLDLTNSLGRLVHALEVHDEYYMAKSKTVASGNMIGAALFATGLALSPLLYGNSGHLYLSMIGASVWTLSTTFGIYTQVAERAAFRIYLQKAKKDLENYMNYLRLIGNNDDMMDIVRNALLSIQTRTIDENSFQNRKVKIHQNGCDTMAPRGGKDYVKTAIRNVIAPSELLWRFIQKKYGLPSKLANEIRNVLSELDNYCKRTQQDND